MKENERPKLFMYYVGSVVTAVTFCYVRYISIELIENGGRNGGGRAVGLGIGLAIRDDR